MVWLVTIMGGWIDDQRTKVSLLARKDADATIPIHHCRTCAEKGCGCCAKGIDIRFNVVK